MTIWSIVQLINWCQSTLVEYCALLGNTLVLLGRYNCVGLLQHGTTNIGEFAVGEIRSTANNFARDKFNKITGCTRFYGRTWCVLFITSLYFSISICQSFNSHFDFKVPPDVKKTHDSNGLCKLQCLRFGNTRKKMRLNSSVWCQLQSNWTHNRKETKNSLFKQRTDSTQTV